MPGCDGAENSDSWSAILFVSVADKDQRKNGVTEKLRDSWSGINSSQPEQKEGRILFTPLKRGRKLFIFALKD